MIAWSYTFIDRAAGHFADACTFWTAVTATRLSAPRGTNDEFATLLPDDGDAYLKIQATGDDGGAHIDLTTADVNGLRDQAVDLGATLIRPYDDWHVMRSPAGQLFCIVPPDGEQTRPGAVTSPNGAMSRLDQVCIDVAPALFDAEIAYWTDLTGWPGRSGSRPEFYLVNAPDTLPVRILVQRLDDDRPTSAHADLACSDVGAVRAWHEHHGAAFVRDGAHWTVMRDPAGREYCLTQRDPRADRRPH